MIWHVAGTPGNSTCQTPYISAGGAEGTRTPDPHTASVVRYQLRHGPAARPEASTRTIVHTADPGVTRESPASVHRRVGRVHGRPRRYMPPWRRSTIDHRSSGRSVKASLGSASKMNHEPVEISLSSWPGGPARRTRRRPVLRRASSRMRVRVAGQVDGAEGAVDPVEAAGLPGLRADPGQADRRLGLHRSALEDDPRIARPARPSLPSTSATGTSVARLSTTPSAPPSSWATSSTTVRSKFGSFSAWGRDEQMPDQRLHRPRPLDHSVAGSGTLRRSSRTDLTPAPSALADVPVRWRPVDAMTRTIACRPPHG